MHSFQRRVPVCLRVTRNVKGLPAGRADIIVAGAEILTSFMDAYEVPHVFVSDQDGMEAMASECESTHSKS